jgi:outer membrane protein with beta-barrel domain
MRFKSSHRGASSGMAVATALVLCALLPAAAAQAEDVLGLYAGGALGQARIEANVGTVSPGSFRENHSAWKAIVGVRPVPIISAEAEYINFGHPNGNIGANPAAVDLKGAAAFGIFTLPIPVIDVFVKAGLARLDSTATGALFHISRTDTNFAGGAGVQYRLGAWGIRGEYERFSAAGGNPSLYTFGVTYTFL